MMSKSIVEKLVDQLVNEPESLTKEQRTAILAIHAASVSKSHHIEAVVRVKDTNQLGWTSGELPNGLIRVYFSFDRDPVAMYPESVIKTDLDDLFKED